jgi:ectoine hydroxylase-related dioxygenase (phytanoyl-CoA dioxygenase family)
MGMPMQAAELMPESSAREDAALSAEQKEKWDRDGYLVLPQFFGADVIDPINALIMALSDPHKRPQALASRLVVDLLSGPSGHQRVRLADAPVEALSRPVKFNDLFLETDIVRGCNLHPRLVPILTELLDGAPAVCNSLNFIQGSEQTEHIDSWFMPPPVLHKMVVSSVCLEDVHPDAGPLVYYPGSHKIPPYRFSDGRLNAIDAEMDDCFDYVNGAIKERGLTRETFIGKKGDVFIWAAQLAHGGSPIKDPARTRRSLVTHYWRASDMPRHKLERWAPGAYYFARDHQPVPSSPLWVRLAARAGLELRWGLRRLRGAPVERTSA